MAKHAGLDAVALGFAMMHVEVFGKTNRYLAHTIMQGRMQKEVTNLRSQIATLTESAATLTGMVQALANAPQSARNERFGSPSSNDKTGWSASPALVVCCQFLSVTVKWKSETFYTFQPVMNTIALEVVMSPALSAYTAIQNKVEGVLPNLLFNGIKLKVAQRGVGFTSKHLPAQHEGVNDVFATRKYYSAIKYCGKHAREKLHIMVATQCGTVGTNCHIIFDEDCQHFNGKNYFPALKARKVNFNLPLEEAVLACVALVAAQAAAQAQNALNPTGQV
ncbi:uncharacterized protein MELLADRAFT_110045 [Melampsora larici-populina 98AG31]|uniref:Uncharacterized protein n=1 Tax=Melampsora larici-populina (strain 98AG31 / pathotype 3-4-7) TaxID=747676 RepID=F4RYH0_MELLP|nr:uncharacterized protein MELLADRAFT_110045 [Melampsora larici-populina 98AG31]EGG02578.1 hypothetical protein MELLADRAFT_110045 [Melampsora larici-populina 98AG31]